MKHIEQLSSRLERIPLRGHGLDSVLTVFLGINYINRFQSISFLYVLKESISFLKQLLKSFIVSETEIDWQKLPLITFMSNRPHINRMSKLLVDELHGDVNVFWSPNSEVNLSVSGTVVKRTSLNYSLSIRNDKELVSAYKSGCNLFKRFLNEQGLSQFRMVSFRIHLRRQLALIKFFESQFKVTQPSAVITEYDRYNEIACLVLASKRFQIPTITQVHGLLNFRMSYAPLISDKVGCWGLWQKKTLMNWEVPEEHILITGATQMSFQSMGSIPGSLSNPSLREGRKIVILATNPTSDIRQRLVEFFCKTMDLLGSDFVGVIRTHPSEKPSDYEQYISSSNVFLPEDENTQNWVFRNSFAVTTFNSAFAIDALLHEKPVFQIQLDKARKSALSQLEEMRVIDSCEDEVELSRKISRAGQSIHEQMFKDKLIEFKSNYCRYAGREAARQFVLHINNYK